MPSFHIPKSILVRVNKYFITIDHEVFITWKSMPSSTVLYKSNAWGVVAHKMYFRGHDNVANPGGHAIEGVGLEPLALWVCWFESHREHGCSPPLVNVMCCAGRCVCDGPIPCPGSPIKITLYTYVE
jgi:hypothetical protein